MTPGFRSRAWLEMEALRAGGVARRNGVRRGVAQAGHAGPQTKRVRRLIAAAEYLIAERYTSPPKLAIGGGSNGGLLIRHRPQSTARAVRRRAAGRSVMTCLRFHKFTIGWAWVDGVWVGRQPGASSLPLPLLRRFTNMKPGTHYPATLITTADHDDRVVPGHSFKYAAPCSRPRVDRSRC